MTALYDILVIGEDEASLCAAACAAVSGARTAVLKPSGNRKRQSTLPVTMLPNFIWRRLDLHEYGLSLEPVSARITLLQDEQSVTTCRNERETSAALAGADDDSHLLWPAFVNEMSELQDEKFLTNITLEAEASLPLPAFLTDLHAMAAANHLAGSSAALLDDYFPSESLKAHVAAHALSLAGLGGSEVGSAFSLPELLDESSWRATPPDDGPSLHTVLEQACEKTGVAVHRGKLQTIDDGSGKYKTISIASDKKLKAKNVFCATPDAAAAAGLDHFLSPLCVSDNATAVMRVRLNKRIEPPAGDNKSVFQIIDNRMELQTARDQVVCGRLPDQLPVEFEFEPNGDIIARTSYCPRAFREDGELRGWTSQDRQVVSARIRQRLESRISDLSENIAKTNIEIIGPYALDTPAVPGAEHIIIQQRRHNAISEAVKLVDKVLSSD